MDDFFVILRIARYFPLRLNLAVVVSASLHGAILVPLLITWEVAPQLLGIDMGPSSPHILSSSGRPGDEAGGEGVTEEFSKVETAESEKSLAAAIDPVEKQETEPSEAAPKESQVEVENPPEDDELVETPSVLTPNDVVAYNYSAQLPTVQHSTSQPSARPARQLRKASVPKGEGGLDATPPSLGSRGSAGADLEGLPRGHAVNPAPQYPPDSLFAFEEGIVVLRVVVGTTGRVDNLKLEKSSGYSALDRSAMHTVNLWRFQPGRRGGIPVPFEVLIPVRFSIRGGGRVTM